MSKTEYAVVFMFFLFLIGLSSDVLSAPLLKKDSAQYSSIDSARDDSKLKGPYLFQIGGGLLSEIYIGLRGVFPPITFDVFIGEHIKFSYGGDSRMGIGLYPVSLPLSKKSLLFVGASWVYSVGNRISVLYPNIMMSARLGSSFNVSSKFGGYYRLNEGTGVGDPSKYGVAFDVAIGFYLQ